jgi:hypothetical protein
MMPLAFIPPDRSLSEILPRGIGHALTQLRMIVLARSDFD